MRSKSQELLREGHAALVTETRREVDKAYAQELPRARDFTCAQVPILRRRLESFNDARQRLRMRLGQVTDRLNFALARRDVDPAQLLAAQDNLTRAIGRYTDLIQRGRVQRKLKIRACRR